MKRKALGVILAAIMITACSSGGTAENIPEGTEESTVTASTVVPEEPESEEAVEDTGTSVEMPDVAVLASDIDNSTIDTALYLDYAAGIEAGVYKWIPSEDGDYYTLASVDENGEPITNEESEINVGANNEERKGNAQSGMKPEGEMPEGGKPEGGMPGEMPQGMTESGNPEGGMPGETPQGMPEGAPGGGDGNGNGLSGMGHGGFGGMGPGQQGTVYQGIYMNGNITNLENQTMLIYVPAEYMETDENGNVTGINHEGKKGNYTADTAPIVYLNECGGWMSSSPRSVDTSYIEQGMVYITAGARSRDAVDSDGKHTGKAPAQMVDLKSGIIELRANTDVIPGNKDRIVSIGTSGGGQMSSILGASGDMKEYYEYMYDSGVLGDTRDKDGNYSSVYSDSVYAAQLYCPIADIENADIAYAWWWVDLADKQGFKGGTATEFDKRLQELEADSFIDYINGLNIKDEKGNELTLTGLRSGTYYDAILKNISDALNSMVEAGEIDPETEYPDSGDWLVKNADGTYSVTDMAGFMTGTGLVNNRNKTVPGFDPMDKSAENNAFGTADQDRVHFSKSVAQILKDNYEELSKLDGFDAGQVDEYIEEALEGENAAIIEEQANLLNATEIMLGNNGLTAVNPAQYWRDRSGTADQHTSFSIGYNICLAAASLGKDIDYHLVWNMGHGNNEGTSTGTFIDWINEICE